MFNETLWPQRRPAVASEFLRLVHYRLYLFVKGGLDFALAVAALICLWPLLLLIAVLIQLDSPGPAIFTQRRAGARWRAHGLRVEWEATPFGCHKFRTMADNCDQSRHQAFITAFATGQLEASRETSLPYKLKDDPRVTRVGASLRKTSLDELPQLFNILKGEMSLVGPRPVPLYEAALYKPWQRERLQALPGLTGLWQVKGRSRVSFDDMVLMDIAYVRNPSIWLDLYLLVATVPAVLSARGAH